jgi:hypothetical protein
MQSPHPREYLTHPFDPPTPTPTPPTHPTASCVAAEPKYGEVWCRVAKDPAHRKLKKDQVLELAAAQFHVA